MYFENEHDYSDNPLPESVRTEILEMGFPDDGYDYTKHLRVIGSGSNAGFKTCFYPSLNQKKALQTDIRVYDSEGFKIPEPVIPNREEKNKKKKTNSNYAFTNEEKYYQIIDPEVMEKLNNSEEELEEDELEEGELEDDFILFANAEDANDDNNNNNNKNNKNINDSNNIYNEVNDDDYDDNDLNERSKGKKKINGGERNKEDESNIFSDASEDEEDGDEFKNDEGNVKSTKSKSQSNKVKSQSQNHRPMRLIDEQFEELALREYNDNDYDYYDELGSADVDNTDVDYDKNLQKKMLAAQGNFEISKFESIINEEYEQFEYDNDDANKNNNVNVVTLDDIRNVLVGNYNVKGKKKNVIYINEKEEVVNDAISSNKKKEGEGEGEGEDEEERQEEDGGEDAEKEGNEIKERIKALYQFTIPENEVHNEEMEIMHFEDGENYEEFDCESIVSTYSNLDNHPSKIVDEEDEKRRRKEKLKKKGEGEKERKEGVIKLVGKEKLPLSFLMETGRAVVKDKGKGKEKEKAKEGKNEKGEGKEKSEEGKGESLEEKRMRKAAVKEARRNARVAKKSLKITYTNESRRGQMVAAKSTPQGIHFN